jgi:tRNA dimethylallyltransferase
VNIADPDRHEIINADSMQIYKDIKIGNNKDKLAGDYLVGKGKKLSAHLFNIRSVTEDFSVQGYQSLAQKLIKDINSRGKIPIMVGGSGLYIAAVIYNYDLEYDEEYGKIKQALVSQIGDDLEKLQKMAKQRNIDISDLNNSDRNNPRRLQNIIAKDLVGRKDRDSRKKETDYELDIEVIQPDIDNLEERLIRRVEKMMALGFWEEVLGVMEKFGYTDISGQIKNAAGYKQIFELFLQNPEIKTYKNFEQFRSNAPLEAKKLIQSIYKSHRQLAKKQLTWNQKYFSQFTEQ